MNRGFALGVSNPLETQAKANYALSPIPEIPASQFSVKGGLLFAGIDGLPRNIVSVDRNNVSPRLGAAYTLTPSTVVRAGYGLFYGPTTLSSDTSLGFNTSTTWNTSINGGLTVTDPLSNPFPGGILQPPGAQQRLLTLVGQGISFADIARPQLYTTQFQFSVERQLPGQMLIQGAYSGSRGHALPASQQIDPIPDSFRAQARQTFISTQKNTLNDSVTNPFYGLIQSGTLAAQTVTRGQLLRPYPQFTSVSALSRSLGGSQYNSFQGKISKRFSHGFNFLVSYTTSKLLSEDTFLNDTDAQLVRRLATFDVPQVLVVSGVFELPMGKGHLLLGNSRGIWGKLVEGWQANGVYSAQSGIPLDVSSAESLGRSAKIPSGQRTLQRWLDASAFRLRETLELVATNRLPDVRSQGRNNLDFSLLKVTSITELCKLQFRAEAFNIFNRAEFAAPNTTLGNSAFGTTTSQINYARQLQLGLRLIW
jgi:hypothetical protein